MTFIDLPDRIQDKICVDPGSGCWWWTHCRNRDGYGVTGVKSKNWLAHRLVYSLLVRALGRHEVLDHLCSNPACVNPTHVQPVTNRRHQRRHADLITHCARRGHEYTPENTYVYNKATGWRRCRACSKIDAREYSERRTLRRREARCKIALSPGR